MSQYHIPKRTKNIYDPGDSKPFKISRAKMDLYINCPKCFYMDRRLGVDRPKGFPFTLNSAVDKLLKKEFDLLRKDGKAHPLIEKYGVDAVPVWHEMLDEWRGKFKGVKCLHEPTNLIITGETDDLWRNSAGEYIVVDYKATSKNEEITELNKEWQNSYKRQMDVYQWLLRRNGLKVSNTGYLIYCNGNTGLEKFDGKLEFDLTLITYEGSDNWVEDKIKEIHACLQQDQIPPASKTCDYCNYREAVEEVTLHLKRIEGTESTIDIPFLPAKLPFTQKIQKELKEFRTFIRL
ncbi:MAG: PD-(D/E)XK nuclease family protein [Candidatus Omnitrophota bacterium]